MRGPRGRRGGRRGLCAPAPQTPGNPRNEHCSQVALKLRQRECGKCKPRGCPAMQCTARNDLLEQRAKSGSFVGAKLTKYRGHRVSLLIYHEHWHQELMPVIMSAAVPLCDHPYESYSILWRSDLLETMELRVKKRWSRLASAKIQSRRGSPENKPSFHHISREKCSEPNPNKR